MENENQKLIDITSYPIVALLDKLLEDKTTKKILYGQQTYMLFLVMDSKIKTKSFLLLLLWVEL